MAERGIIPFHSILLALSLCSPAFFRPPFARAPNPLFSGSNPILHKLKIKNTRKGCFFILNGGERGLEAKNCSGASNF